MENAICFYNIYNYVIYFQPLTVLELIYEKIKAAGVNPSDLEEPLNVLFEKASSLKTEPIVLSTDSSIPKQDLEELQIVDLDDDQE